MPPLFKYLPRKYTEAFVSRGELLFRSLSYFRNYEELLVRGDRHEGRRLYRPPQGLELTKTETGEKMLLPWAFESNVKDREVYVFCLSVDLSPELGREFGTDTCIEVTDAVALVAKVRSALKLRRWVRQGRVLHGRVEYYSPEQEPQAEWAVPERMIMRKTHDYQHQREYRFAFARGNALEVNNVETLLTSTPGSVQPTLEGHPEYVLKVGSLAKVCRIHTLA
ncbi:MAG: hypothetical protein KIS62_07520 [Ramlibacter sp.]|nr:hypothetical protein [Ramlibacter sp.]